MTWELLLLSLSQLVVGLLLAAALVMLVVAAVQAHRRGIARVRRDAQRTSTPKRQPTNVRVLLFGEGDHEGTSWQR